MATISKHHTASVIRRTFLQKFLMGLYYNDVSIRIDSQGRRLENTSQGDAENIRRSSSNPDPHYNHFSERCHVWKENLIYVSVIISDVDVLISGAKRTVHESSIAVLRAKLSYKKDPRFSRDCPDADHPCEIIHRRDF